MNQYGDNSEWRAYGNRRYNHGLVIGCAFTLALVIAGWALGRGVGCW